MKKLEKYSKNKSESGSRPEFRTIISGLLKPAALILIMALVIIPQTGCGNKEPVSKSDFCLNTTCEIKIYDMDSSEAEEILDGAFEEISRYENLLSKTVEDSDVYRINAAGGQPVEVSEDTVNVIKLGIQMGNLSDGKFDITIGQVSDLWNFTGENPHVPDAAQLKRAIESVDYRTVEIEGSEVSIKNGSGNLDLGGVAKGYIADRTGEYLEDQGVERAIINLGGNVVALGSKSDDEEWNIGIERPYSDRTELAGSVQGKDVTLVTSGIYERKFEENGVLYHHVLDPATGYPADTDLESVTIMAKKGNSAFCDGLSTVCLILGKEKAMELIVMLQEKYPEKCLEAAFIDKNDDMVQTEGMNVRPVEDNN